MENISLLGNIVKRILNNLETFKGYGPEILTRARAEAVSGSGKIRCQRGGSSAAPPVTVFTMGWLSEEVPINTSVLA